VQAGGLIFVAGQGPFDPRSGAVIGHTIQEQTAQCLRNITAILHAARSSLEQAVSATFLLADPSEIAGMNEEWARWFPSDPPARQGARHPLAGQGPRISSPWWRRRAPKQRGAASATFAAPSNSARRGTWAIL